MPIFRDDQGRFARPPATERNMSLIDMEANMLERTLSDGASGPPPPPNATSSPIQPVSEANQPVPIATQPLIIPTSWQITPHADIAPTNTRTEQQSLHLNVSE